MGCEAMPPDMGQGDSLEFRLEQQRLIWQEGKKQAIETKRPVAIMNSPYRPGTLEYNCFIGGYTYGLLTFESYEKGLQAGAKYKKIREWYGGGSFEAKQAQINEYPDNNKEDQRLWFYGFTEGQR